MVLVASMIQPMIPLLELSLCSIKRPTIAAKRVARKNNTKMTRSSAPLTWTSVDLVGQDHLGQLTFRKRVLKRRRSLPLFKIQIL